MSYLCWIYFRFRNIHNNKAIRNRRHLMHTATNINVFAYVPQMRHWIMIQQPGQFLRQNDVLNTETPSTVSIINCNNSFTAAFADELQKRGNTVYHIKSVAALPCKISNLNVSSIVLLCSTLFNANVMQNRLFTVSAYQKCLNIVSYIYTD